MDKDAKARLTAQYWQWIYSHPEKDSPLKTGVVNLDDTVMLPCTGGGVACDRSVVLSEKDASKNILVPVFAAMKYGTIGKQNLSDMARIMSTAKQMEMSIDNIPQDYEHIESQFEIKGFEAVSSGYWHIHPPLPKGKHIIKFGGDGKYDDFFTKVQYELEVK